MKSLTERIRTTYTSAQSDRMIKHAKTNYSRFGVIVELTSPTTMKIRTRYANGSDVEIRPVSQVVPIVAKSLISEVKE